MCTQGVNLTQFKLSVHQLAEMSKGLERATAQWKELIEKLGQPAIAAALGEAAGQNSLLTAKLEAVISAATKLEEGDDGVTITPL